MHLILGKKSTVNIYILFLTFIKAKYVFRLTIPTANVITTGMADRQMAEGLKIWDGN